MSNDVATKPRGIWDNVPRVDSWDSFEGIPDWLPPTPAAVTASAAEAERRGAFGQGGHDALSWLAPILPGVTLAAFIIVVGTVVSVWLGRHFFHMTGDIKSPVSPVLIAVTVGLLIRNVFGVPKTYEPGLKWCTRAVLRAGIVLLGLGLYVGDVALIGVAGLPVIIGCIAATLIMVTWLNKLLGLPRRLGTLIAVGTSICGVSAIVATAPAIDADEDETSYAIACITIFGLVAMFTYPWLAHGLFGDHFRQAGVFLGTSVHDMAQCTGAAAMFSQQYAAKVTQDVAITVKMLRNLGMSVLVPAMAIYYRRGERLSAATGTQVEDAAAVSGLASFNKAHRQRWYEVVPTFVIGFMLMAALRSMLDRFGAGRLDAGSLHEIYAAVGTTSHWCFGIAMAAVGLGTGLSRLRGLGWRPFTVGCFAAAMVGVVSWILVGLLIQP